MIAMKYLLVDDDESLVGSIAQFLLQVNDLLNTSLDKVTLSLYELLTFIG